ncbi:amidohydrolase [Maribacter algicola]|uniref:Amidohydrolase n=1 Tax=Maribacter algicola TaxID=2498892 RepID=A0A3R8R4F6_9FLAO|nr:amidohydrolase family protein [Maribacter algicola]RRQ49758.1 amidohydrolase [Maribacter algicola]
MGRIILFGFIIFLGLISCKETREKNHDFSTKAILVYNATIIDVVNGNVLKDKAILIDSGIIKRVGDYNTLKSMINLNNQINVEGKFIIPGLWDMHVHIEGQDLVDDNLALLPVFVAYGITTVRDMASDLGEQVLAWREDIKEDKLLGPQIFTAGRKLEGINSIWKGDLEIANEDDLSKMLDKLEAYNVDLVKITENTLAGPLFLKSVQEARKRGFKVSGHIPIDLTIQEVVDAGFTSIEHASYLLRLGSDEKGIVERLNSGDISRNQANAYYSTAFNQDTAMLAYQKLSKTNIAITPTLIGGKQLAYLEEDDHSEDDFLEFLTDRFTANYQWRIDRMANDTPEQKMDRKKRYELIAKQLPYIQKAGIKILAGSDAAALNTFVYPALSLHQELELFQKAGLTSLEILQSATINGAELMGQLNTMGTIEANKQADMVILNSNPLLDIRGTRDIYAVINDGQYFNRTDLDSLLNEAKQTKKRLDKERK